MKLSVLQYLLESTTRLYV